jgi:hypothetical protein
MKEAPHAPGTPVSLKPSRKASRFVLVAAVVVLLGALSYYLLPKNTPARENLVWMTPHGVAQALQPGKLDTLRFELDALAFRLLRGSASALNWYSRGKKQVAIESRLFGFPATAAQPKGLPQTCFTNVDGTRGWILTGKEWTHLAPELQGAAGTSAVSVVRLATLAGRQCSLSSGTLKLDSRSRIVGRCFDLLFCATSTTGSGATSQTNFAIAGRVKLPNGGALVANRPGSPLAAGTNYWYVLTPQAIDAAGNSTNL